MTRDENHREPSAHHQDYVIKDGKFVGDFEAMYRNSSEIPWHQDRTADAVFRDICVSIVRRCNPDSLLDVGCGMGYMADRLRREVPRLKSVAGLDVSETAIAEARKMFPSIRFVADDLVSALPGETFGIVVSKDVLWYVADDLTGYIQALAERSEKWVCIGQSFPSTRPYYGEDILPDAASLIALLQDMGFEIDYQVIERDADYGNREYAHAVLKINVRSGDCPTF
jgi:SAM-dependent methyltransferase